MSGAARSRMGWPQSSNSSPMVFIGASRRISSRRPRSTAPQQTPDSANKSSGETRRYTVRLAVSAARVPVRRTASSTAPARAIFSAAYQQAAVTSRRLLRQPKAAAVMASAVVIL